VKKRPPYNQNAMIRGSIRRTFSRSPVVREVLMAGRREVPKHNKDGSLAKKPAVQYQCQVCNCWVSSTKVTVDHIEPVISVDEGFVDWNQFVARLFCDKVNLQRICDDCHDAKTQKERIARLLNQYHQELLGFEMAVMQGIIPADYKKMLNKYIAKKKTIGLEEIVQRARELKDHIELFLKGKSDVKR
jgi:hypothetical protein